MYEYKLYVLPVTNDIIDEIIWLAKIYKILFSNNIYNPIK